MGEVLLLTLGKDRMAVAELEQAGNPVVHLVLGRWL
jgi:hypothetical protein